MKIKPRKGPACLLLGLLGCPALAEVKVITVFEAEAMVRSLRDLYPALGVSAMGNQLVLSGTAQQLQEAEALMARLNQPPAMLLIEWRVSQGSDTRGVSLGARSGGDGDWRAGGALGQGREQGEQAWQIRGLSGRPVLLQLGSYRPVSFYRWRGDRVTALLPIISGLYASATLVGERVRIQLASEQASLGQGVPEHGQSATELDVVPGQWIEVGALADSRQSQALGLGRTLGGSLAEEARQQTLAIRVTPLD
ncbi:hypothetical protein ACEUBT_10770 [Aeromonas bivalvium]|uniref:hypothetical protein n=1 Tax=Aeromonas bivalvium TaxID=440079 RepID=UPI0038CFE115